MGGLILVTDLTWGMKGMVDSSVSFSSVSKSKSAMGPEVGEDGRVASEMGEYWLRWLRCFEMEGPIWVQLSNSGATRFSGVDEVALAFRDERVTW